MSAGWRFRFRQYRQINLWMIPVLSALAGGLLAFAMVTFDNRWDSLVRLNCGEGVTMTFLISLLGATVTLARLGDGPYT